MDMKIRRGRHRIVVVTLGVQESKRLEVDVENGGCTSEQRQEWDLIRRTATETCRKWECPAYEIYAAKRCGGHLIDQVPVDL